MRAFCGTLFVFAILAAGPVRSATADSDSAFAAAFRSLLHLKNSTNADADHALNRAAGDILRSPTGRAFARRFVQQNVPFDIEVSGTSNFTQMEDRHIVIADSDLTHSPIGDHDVVRLLAHELLGHALLGLESARYGDLSIAVENWEGNEERADLVGWVVQAELGYRMPDYWRSLYLRGRENYWKEQRSLYDDYAGQLSLKKMGSPRAELEKRIHEIHKRQADLERAIKTAKSQADIIAHFESEHHIPESVFSGLRENVDDLEAKQVATNEIASMLDVTNEYIGEGRGAAQLAAQAQSPFFAKYNQEIGELRRKLRQFNLNPSADDAPRQTPEAIDWQTLKYLHEWDMKENPGHYPGRQNSRH